ncbi:Rab family GTPase [Candidatus Leptofilum sp.]|uniref:Rab family GTPase n=1 Tax=Candidatus Leptofilum sp. TaxID=3241576 RepID=UPI003B5CAFCA
MATSIPLLKIVVAGDGNVGKTSLIRQYCEGRFEQSRVATIGVDFQTKTIEIKGHTIKLSIWDMAGQIHFQSVRTGLYRGSRTAALVHDVTNPDSLAHLQSWYDEITVVVPQQRFLVVGNKIDLMPNYDSSEAKRFAASIKAPYLATSASSGHGVQKMFLGMAYLALKK